MNDRRTEVGRRIQGGGGKEGKHKKKKREAVYVDEILIPSKMNGISYGAQVLCKQEIGRRDGEERRKFYVMKEREQKREETSYNYL